eukprot:TRINITY_DN10818_c0_g1_i2.p1 TRINITY_DN10818_c0_g1~~TRINITY_DN10818_c0_g1_i2.p1  ORF type:complete len:278 (+),score=8.45 TRINITY_DN10818_c0_g1_i2:51-884(+)
MLNRNNRLLSTLCSRLLRLRAFALTQRYASTKRSKDASEASLSQFQEQFGITEPLSHLSSTAPPSPPRKPRGDVFSIASVEHFGAKLAKIPRDLSKRQQFRRLQPSKALLDRLTRMQLGKAREDVRRTDPTQSNQELLAQQYLSTRRLKFIGATRHPSTIPPATSATREVAFAGRSNVGKSTLVNHLTKSRPAATENKPGVTQKLSFYDVTSERRVVDLPGYGFAFTREQRQQLWESTMGAMASSRTIVTSSNISRHQPLVAINWYLPSAIWCFVMS